MYCPRYSLMKIAAITVTKNALRILSSNETGCAVWGIPTYFTRLINYSLVKKCSTYSLSSRQRCADPDYKTATSIHEFTVKNIKGEDVKLDVYRGHVCIIVNVASQCGLTANHYTQLNEMYDRFAEKKGRLSIKESNIISPCGVKLYLPVRKLGDALSKPSKLFFFYVV